MENNVKKKNNSVIIIAILCILLLASIGFICYDKFLKKEEKSKDCNCPTCEKCSNEKGQEIKLKMCTLDMNGKTSIDVQAECETAATDGYDSVAIKNIKVNSKIYELKYRLVYDDITNDDQLAYDNSVTKIYVNNKLLDAFPGQFRNTLMSLKVSNSKLILSEAYPSDVPAADHTYDLSDFD